MSVEYYGRYKRGGVIGKRDAPFAAPKILYRRVFLFSFTSTSAFSNNCDGCVSTYELPFETTSSRRFCGGVKSDLDVQNTQTRSLSVVFFYDANRGGGFNLEYSSQSKCACF